MVKRLRAGMAVSFAEAAGERTAAKPIGAAPPDSSPAPPSAAVDGARDFEGVTVSELVAEANGVSPRPIRLADEAIGRRRVSGRFRIDDSAVFAERLALLFDLRVDLTDPQQIVLRPK
jgi:transmembrane sensor